MGTCCAAVVLVKNFETRGIVIRQQLLAPAGVRGVGEVQGSYTCPTLWTDETRAEVPAGAVFADGIGIEAGGLVGGWCDAWRTGRKNSRRRILRCPGSCGRSPGEPCAHRQ